MGLLLPFRSVLFVVLVAATAQADEREKRALRTVLLSEHPERDTHRIYVKGQVITTLRFETLVDPDKTKMIGWEGRLEPLAVVRNKVILEPLHDLNDDEAIPMVVTLMDGTEVPFLLRPPRYKDWGWTDQQVDVFKNRESHAAMHAALLDALEKNATLSSENERFRKEETSEDHALAALLASGAIKQTPFTAKETFSGKDEDSDVRATVFRGKDKVAVIFQIKNLHAENPWSVQRVQLSTLPEGKERSVAVRSSIREIPPGGAGVVAIVADGSAFMDEGVLKDLSLEVYRQDGQRQVYVALDHRLIAR
ncbi:hypothetical protein CYFUS_001160 [Cystobacter fuscus]|uniref:DUF2381 family protein n=1 Tax=Cystobacter fuscus TaxID=43 RepID=A0A250IXV6_9BACT|nr:DUF2381 family protein [Cystobacter fuscus]ATB35746.1 hypothetical protein CYFUS_001160 [Cystobacter fuscus]